MEDIEESVYDLQGLLLMNYTFLIRNPFFNINSLWVHVLSSFIMWVH